jgi:hypothetical protein
VTRPREDERLDSSPADDLLVGDESAPALEAGPTPDLSELSSVNWVPLSPWLAHRQVAGGVSAPAGLRRG